MISGVDPIHRYRISGAAMGNARILIVEDDKNVAKLLETILTKNGYQVSGVVTTGEEAVDVALEARPDLVLINIKLKGIIDGIAAFEQIRMASGIPVIFVSGYSDTDTMARAMRSRPSGYLTKPFRAWKLLVMVEKALMVAEMPPRL